MEENTNKTIFINSIILYVRLFLVTICSLFTTRFALKALGVVDFGLFSLLGSIITQIYSYDGDITLMIMLQASKKARHKESATGCA